MSQTKKAKNIAVIGGGIGGLVAAYRLGQKGNKVTVFEKEKELGGLLADFDINGTRLEKVYHHIFESDKAVIGLIEELGLKEKLQWNVGKIGLYFDKKVYPFSGPIDLLKFGAISLPSRIRMGLVGLYLQKDNNWEKYIKVPAYKWMKKACGEEAYRVVWEPLLRGKFHDFYDKISMAWLWARIHTRGQSKLGYLIGGFGQITQRLAKRIKENGGKIVLDKEVKMEDLKNYDQVISTAPSGEVKYLGAVNLVFTSSQSLSQYYWHNINDTHSPFLAFIQQTNLIDKKNYQNEEVYYLGTYVPQTHRYFKEDCTRDFFDYLKKIWIEFDESKVTSKRIFRFKYAQHIVDTKYQVPKDSRVMNFAQIFPQDRGVNYAVAAAEKLAASQQ